MGKDGDQVAAAYRYEDYTGVSGPVGPAGPPAGANWRPSGIIKVYDDKKGTIALQGVTVRARRWFTTYEGVTNADGYYSVNGQFKRPANYSIIWSTGNKWVIRKGWFLPAFYNGPKKQGAWDLSIDRGAGATLSFATIHRAAYRMYYKDILDLKRPSYYRSMKLCYLEKSGSGDYWGNVGLGILPDIRIYGKHSNGTSRTTNNIFSTTVHELAHAAHLQNVGHVIFWQYKKYIYESWAVAVEKEVTEQEYIELCDGDYYEGMKLFYGEPKYIGGSGPGPKPYAVGNLPFYEPDNIMNYQKWPFTDHGKTMEDKNGIAYTPMFIDLVDNENQREYYRHFARKLHDYKPMTNEEIETFCGQSPDDGISHFTLKEVQDIVYNKSYGFSNLKRNIKNTATGRLLGADAIDNFFERYEYYIEKYGKSKISIKEVHIINMFRFNDRMYYRASGGYIYCRNG